ncbi:MAG: hypothetical protein KKF56_05125 [Nanoarchaeota archaeon]|nr:hypothetical protein [Nanoarchaeota archaeon]
MAWKKTDSQSWKRNNGKELLYADEDVSNKGETIYVVRYEDQNGESIIFKDYKWQKALNYAKKVSKQSGLIKTHPSVYKI